MKYKVLTDSTCDLPEEAVRAHGIDVICFKLALDGQGYVERQDFAPSEFCRMLRAAKSLPTTAQITEYEFLERFERYAEEGADEVIYVSINAGGSATNANAQFAREEFYKQHPESAMHITVVDSRGYSMAQGQPILEACEKLEAGEPMDSVVDWLRDRYARMEILLTAYSLKVIRKSGRISAAAAIAGEVLGIHPVFTLNDGVSHVVRKVRGEKAVLGAMTSLLKTRMVPGVPYYIGVTDRALYEEEYKAACTEAVGYPPVCVFDLGAAVQSNTGPDAVGIVYEGTFRERT
ncbi:MAG: DegV family protein [Clostridia bacterium]|nr:DegV family protein [Clostridia bacterium]